MQGVLGQPFLCIQNFLLAKLCTYIYAIVYFRWAKQVMILASTKNTKCVSSETFSNIHLYTVQCTSLWQCQRVLNDPETKKKKKKNIINPGQY